MSKYKVYLSKSNSALNSDTEKIRAELEKLDIEIIQHKPGTKYNNELVTTCNFLIIVPPFCAEHEHKDYLNVGKGQSDQIDRFDWTPRTYVARFIDDRVIFQALNYKTKLELDWISNYAQLTCSSTRKDLVDLVLLHKNQLIYKPHKTFKTPEELLEKVKPIVKKVVIEKLNLSGRESYSKGRLEVVDDAFDIAEVVSPTKLCWNGSTTLSNLKGQSIDDVVKQLADKIRKQPRVTNTDEVMLACSLLID